MQPPLPSTPWVRRLMASLLLIGMMLALHLQTDAQTYLMSTSNDTTCSGVFYDSGGSAGNYGSSQNLTKTFVSANGERLNFAFTSFSTENCCDYLDVYDGPTTAYPYLGRFRGTTSPGNISSSANALTFRFVSDGGTTSSGWQANITCIGPVIPAYNMSSGTVTTCSAVFYDVGGPNGNYPNNENRVQTFCSGTTDRLAVDFTASALSISAGDSLYIYDGPNTAAPRLAVYTGSSIANPLVSSGTCITFEFKSNGATNSSGWQAFIACQAAGPVPQDFVMSTGVRYVCDGNFYDSGGPSANYGSNENRVMTFGSYNGNRIQFNFSSLTTENCCDYLAVYDGPTTAHPLIGVYRGALAPFTLLSSGRFLTFQFVSDGSNTASGWAAAITCAGPLLPVYPHSSGTTTTCEGVFTDALGPALNYPDNENRTQTFCSGTTDHIAFAFNNQAFTLSSGDSLFVFDGPTTASPRLAAYTLGSFVEPLVSSGTCLTFYFKSTASGNSQGWQSLISCQAAGPVPLNYAMSTGVRYVCDGNFYDSGGPSANYGSNENRVMTFGSYNGNRIQFNFSSLTTENCCDYLAVYDGPTTAHPLIGVYRGALAPFTLLSSGRFLTFQFVSDGNNTASGWAAAITCAGPLLPVYPHSSGTTTTCEGVFTDALGPALNYPDNENRTQTFCSGTTDHIAFAFNNQAFTLSSGDSLFVFDGPTTASPRLAAYTLGSFVEPLVSSGTCLTFYFKSTASGNSQGWQSLISCQAAGPVPLNYAMSTGVRYVCDGNFYDSGGPSANYGSNENRVMTFGSYNGNRIQFNFSSLTTENCCDYLAVYDGPTTAHPLIGVYRGALAPFTLLSSGRFLTFQFVSDGSNTASGWAAAISCAGPLLPVYPHSSGTTTTCEGVFTDALGPALNYPDNENRTQTFCSGTTDHLAFAFNNQAFTLSSGDSLFVFDGPTTASPRLAAYTLGSFVEPLVSSGTCLTFYFKSTASGNSQGWQSLISCQAAGPVPLNYAMSTGVRYVCDGNFYDSGGPSANYGSNENRVMTFGSYNGNRIQFNFSSLTTENCCDYLAVYDGPTTAHPLIGVYRGALAPFTLLSSGRFLTFQFVSDGSNTASGWAAAITCAGPLLPVYPHSSGTITACEGVFTDAGGPAANYPNNENRVQTFCSGTSDHLSFAFNLNAFTLSAGDTLWVYDGNATSAPPIAAYTEGSIVETPLISTGTCLTFRFQSNASTNSQGWQALFSCTQANAPTPAFLMSTGIRYTCGGDFYDNGGPSANYGSNLNRAMTFVSTSGCGLRVSFTAFATEPCCDRLFVYDGPSTASTLIGTYSGTTLPPNIQSTGSALTFRFQSDGSNTASGWAANFSCPTTALATVTPSGPQTVCQGSTVTLTASNGQSWLWNNGATTQSIAAGISGQYYVQVTDVSGCTAISAPVAVQVNPNAPATITPSGATSFCAGGQVTLNASIGNSYLWSTGATTSSIVVNSAGTYTVTVSSTNGCGAGTPSQAVTVLPLPSNTVTPSGPTTFCTGGSVTLTADPASSYLWSTGATSQSILVSSTGTYTVTVTGANGCTNTSAPVGVSVTSPGAATITPSGSTTLCQGSAVTLSASSGQSYLWSNGATSQDILVSQAGSYTVTITYAGGCSSIASPQTVTVLVPTPASITPGGATTFCAGGSVTLSANSGSAYLWSTGASTQNITATTSGTYSVTVTGANGCPSVASQVVTVNATPNATITPSGPTTFCAGFDVTLSVPASGSYLWSNGATSQSITVGTAGNYSVTVTTAAGCSAISSPVTVTLISAPAASITPSGPTTFCQGGIVSLSANAAAGYLWSNGATTQSINVFNSGTYTVTVTYANGCNASSASQAVNVLTPTPATLTAAGPTTFCPGGSVTLSASSGNSYLWSTGATTQSISATTSGNYSVTVTGSNGCGAAAGPELVTVLSAPNAIVTPSGPTSFCAGGSVTLTASSNSGYLWSNGASTPSITVSTSGTFTVTVTGANGCTNTSSPTTVTVNAPTQATITPGGSTSLCPGSSILLSASAGQSYLWSTGATTASIAVSTAGTYSVTVTDLGGCTSVALPTTVNLLSTTPASITPSGPTSFCQGGSVSLSASGGNAYLWSNGATTQTISVGSSGSYTVTVTDANGCNASASPQAVTVLPLPSATVSASGPTTFCQGGSVVLTAAPANSYLWSTGAITSSITVANSGSYQVTLTGANGCTNVSNPVTVTVTAPTQATITPGGPTTFCQGEDVTLSASAGQSFLWSNGATSQSVLVLTGGSYTVTVTEAGGCTSTAAPITVTVHPTPIVNANVLPDTVCNLSAPFALPSGSPAGGIWTGTGVTGNTFDPLFAGIGPVFLTYLYTDINGCTGFDLDEIYVDICLAAGDPAPAWDFQVWPNPTQGAFQVELRGGDDPSALELQVMDMTGRIVWDGGPLGGRVRQVQALGLAQGVYVVALRENGKVILRERLVVQ